MADRRSGWKRWRGEAKPKERGKPVDVDEATTDARLDAIALNVQRAAMQKIVSSLPVSQRRDWPTGNAFHELVGPTFMFTIEIENKRGKQIRAYLTVPLGTVMEDPVRQKACGEQLADHLIKDILTYYRSDRKDSRKRQGALTAGDADDGRRTRSRGASVATAGAAASADDLRRLLERTPTKVIPDEKERPKPVGKLGPFCIICGPEDRDTYPSWGGCPHGASDDTG